MRAVCSQLEDCTNTRTKWIKIVGLANENYGARKDISELSSCDVLKPTLDDFYYYGAGAAVKTLSEKCAELSWKKSNLASVSVKYIGVSRFNEQELDELLTKYEEECRKVVPLTIEEEVKLYKEGGESAVIKLKEKLFYDL